MVKAVELVSGKHEEYKVGNTMASLFWAGTYRIVVRQDDRWLMSVSCESLTDARRIFLTARYLVRKASKTQLFTPKDSARYLQPLHWSNDL